MSIYDLRDIFPFKGQEFSNSSGNWVCHLAEVSDSRPDNDRLSWYLVFEPIRNSGASMRKLELVTPGTGTTAQSFSPELKIQMENWLASGEQDGRMELLGRD